MFMNFFKRKLDIFCVIISFLDLELCVSCTGWGEGGFLWCPASHPGAQARQEETQEAQEGGEGQDQG